MMQHFLIYLFLQTLYMFQAEEPPETCRASVEINKSRNVCILLVVIWIILVFAMYGHMNVKFQKCSQLFHVIALYDCPDEM